MVAAPVAAPVEEAAPPPVVDKGIDPDKLLQEFDTLMAAPPAQAVEAGKDSGQKLIDEFENFMKGSGGT